MKSSEYEESLAKRVIEEVESSFKRVSIKDVKGGEGSFIYCLYNENDELLYVGETGVSIKSRLTGDGSGAHNRKEWYSQISYVKYIKNDKLSGYGRKMIENALCIEHSPKYNK